MNIDFGWKSLICLCLFVSVSLCLSVSVFLPVSVSLCLCLSVGLFVFSFFLLVSTSALIEPLQDCYEATHMKQCDLHAKLAVTGCVGFSHFIFYLAAEVQ